MTTRTLSTSTPQSPERCFCGAKDLTGADYTRAEGNLKHARDACETAPTPR